MDQSFDKYVVHDSQSVIPEPVESMTGNMTHNSVAYSPKTVSVDSVHSTYNLGDEAVFKMNFNSGVAKNYSFHLAGKIKNTSTQAETLTSGIIGKIDNVGLWVGGVQIYDSTSHVGLVKGLLNEYSVSTDYKTAEGSILQCYDRSIAVNGTVDFSLPLSDLLGWFSGSENLGVFPYTMLAGTQLELHIKFVSEGVIGSKMAGAANSKNEFSDLRLVASQVNLSPAMSQNINQLMDGGRMITYPSQNMKVERVAIANGATSVDIKSQVASQYLEGATVFFYPQVKAQQSDTRLYGNPSVSNVVWSRGTDQVLGSGKELTTTSDLFRETKKAFGEMSSDVSTSGVTYTTYTRPNPSAADIALFCSHISFQAFPELDHQDSVDNSNNTDVSFRATIDAPVALYVYMVLHYKKYVVLKNGAIAVHG